MQPIVVSDKIGAAKFTATVKNNKKSTLLDANTLSLSKIIDVADELGCCVEARCHGVVAVLCVGTVMRSYVILTKY